MINFKLILLKNKKDKNENYPIYLRLTKIKYQKYINTNIKCKENEWDEVTCKINRNNIDHKSHNLILGEIIVLWTSRFNSLPIELRTEISIEEFLDCFDKEKQKKKNPNFFDIINEKIVTLKKTNRIGNSECYKDTRNSILSFTKTEKLTLKDIDIVWLKNYENYLRMRKCVESGISLKMRVIRSIYNECIENEYISRDLYPFKTYKISKLKQEKNIRAISIEQMERISNLDTNLYPKLKLSKDIFMFSYYTAGMNYKDIILLKDKNIYNGNRISFIRSKTNGLFDFKLNDKAIEIIQYYKDRNIGTDYIFPILLKNNLTPIQIAYRRKKCLSKFNRDLKEIGKLCNIDIELTSYVARHSFASNLKSKGVATDIISEAMGHQDIKITQVYLKRLDNEVIDNVMDMLGEI
jgi:integrase/recombinase XerD